MVIKMRNRKVDIALAVLILIAAATVLSLAMRKSSPKTGVSGGNPSILHTTLEGETVEEADSVYEQVDTYSTNIDTYLVYDSAVVEKGQSVTFVKGSQIIVDRGSMSAVCSDHLINVTKGISVYGGETLTNYDLYVITDDDDSVIALENSEIFIKGGYKINENNKE